MDRNEERHAAATRRSARVKGGSPGAEAPIPLHASAVPILHFCHFGVNFIDIMLNKGSWTRLLPTPLILPAIQQYRNVW